MWIEVILIMVEFMLLYGIALKCNKDYRSFEGFLFIMVESMLLYGIALKCNKDYRSFLRTFLFISPKQWGAIIVFMLLTIIAALKR